MRRGEIKERIDPKFIYHGGHQEIKTGNRASLGNLVAQEPDYGAAERAIPISSPDEVKYIRITDYGEDGIEPNHEFVTAEFVDEKFLLEEDDILFARSGATAGKTFIYTKELSKAIFAGYCIRFRFDKNKVLPKYVYFYTKTERYATWVNSMQRAAGQPNINKEEYKSFTIPLPPLETQRALVAEMESARAVRQSKLAQAESLLKGIDQFVLDELGIKLPKEEKQQVFGLKFGKMGQARIDPNFHHPDFYKLTRSLQKTNTEKLENLVEFSSEIWNPIEEKASTFFYIEISGVNIQTGEVTATEVPVDEAPSRARMIVKEGDILVSLTRPHRGAIALLDKSLENCVASTGFAVLRKITKENILREYLWAILHNPICLRQMLQRSSGGNYPAITDAELKQISIPIPSIDIQKKIVSELQNRRAQARSLREEAERQWRDAKVKFEKALLG